MDRWTVIIRRIILGIVYVYLGEVSIVEAVVLNNPYPQEASSRRVFYGSFPEAPKTLDPAKAYNVNESLFIEQIVEPLLEYHYLKRPYQLVPLVAAAMPKVAYYNAVHQRVRDPEKQSVAYSVYTISVRPGIYYHPHPAFAKKPTGAFYYEAVSSHYLRRHFIRTERDFKHQGQRELKSDDFIYQIKRLADPHINSPIYGLMEDYIVGLQALNRQLGRVTSSQWLDLRQFPLSGVRKIDDYTFEIQIKGRYQPFLYWLAMHFFSPIPWEVDRFYAQPGMQARNMGFDWNPIGTGPFMLQENNPNRRMVLVRNPHYRDVRFPSEGEPGDKPLGYLVHAGEKLPLIDAAVYTLEKEAIPRWNKFLQGYYDNSAIAADSYDQAIHLNSKGEAELTPEMQARHIRLVHSLEPAIYYVGFNMLDPVVGGATESARLLRLAVSLAINTEESIALFYNGRGQIAQGPIPPGIFGDQTPAAKGNPWLYEQQDQERVRRPLAIAKKWLRLAGYPQGQDPKTHKALLLNYDVAASGGPDEKAQLEWMRKQLSRIGISLNVRATQYNRFQEKMRTGNAQLFSWGWKADYPDPENFLFLLYGRNGKVYHGGENASNYANPQFDRLFERVRNRKNDTLRAHLINEMLTLIQHDAPWIWGFYSQTLVLSQPWVSVMKPNTMILNTLKYLAIDTSLRQRLRSQWNQAILWPLGVVGLLLGAFLGSLWLVHRRQENHTARRYPSRALKRTDSFNRKC